MIEQDRLIEVGRITKTHGLNGELNVTVTDDVFAGVAACPYFVLEMDGIFVPFFVGGYRMRGAAAMLLRLDGVDTRDAAEAFCGHTLWFDRRCFTPAEAEAYDTEAEEELGLVGYALDDSELGRLGTIVAIDDQTANILFIVERPDGSELLVPAADDLIDDIDDETRTVTMHLPAGLVNMDQAESE